MNNMQVDNMSGITILGNILVDIVHMLDKFPQKNMLANILSSVRAVGGCVPNTLIDIAKIDPQIPLKAVGKVGMDENGRYLVSEMKKYGIDTDGIVVDAHKATAFTDVMTDSTSGERTFFYSSGANSTLCIDDVKLDLLNCKILHAGYILLLEDMDREDDEYGTKLARLLANAQSYGIRTSIDVVSEDGNRFTEKVVPALKYSDYAILNEVEATKVSGLPPRNENGDIITENIKETMKRFFEHGVREKVIVHCPEAGFMMDKDGSFYASGSLILPDGYIKGSVGAGDAYAAACLYGIYNEMMPLEILEFASAAAACNLSQPDSVSGMRSKEEIMDISGKYNKRKI